MIKLNNHEKQRNSTYLNSLLIHKINFSINRIFICILFFSLLSAALGIDKLAVICFILLAFVSRIPYYSIEKRKLFLLIVLISYIVFISLINGVFKPIVFYPIIGLILVDFFVEDDNYLILFKKVLFFYILLSLIGGIAAYLIGSNLFVTSLSDKGLPFIKPILGLTSTVQTFGSLCVLWIIINFNTKIKKSSYEFFIVSLAILMTFNRSTYLFFVLVLSLYSRGFLFSLVIVVFGLYLIYFEYFNSIVFNSSTLSSRSELLQGFYLSYWEANTFTGYLFGKANNYYSPQVLKLVKWNHRPDIENLYAMVLHTYGFIGMVFYLVMCFLLSVYVFLKKNWRLAFILFFYLFFTQFFTQELVTNVFYLFVAAILSICKYENPSN